MASTSPEKIDALNKELKSLEQQLTIANNNNPNKTAMTEDQMNLELQIERLRAQIEKSENAEKAVTSGGKRSKSNRRKTAKKASRRKSKRRNSKK